MKRALFAVILSAAATAFAATPDPAYIALRAARPDGRTIDVEALAVDRDAYHFTFTGSFYPLTPVNGVTTGAVFIGNGTFTLTPANDDEARQLRIETNDDKLTALSDEFKSAVFFDAPLVKIAEAAGAVKAGSPAPAATSAFDEFLKKERKDFTTNLHIRVLQELLDPLQPPLFLAYLRGRKIGPALLAHDVRGADALRLFEIGDGG